MNVRWVLALLLFVSAGALAQSAGGVTGWGDTNLNQLNFPPGLTNITMVSCGAEHSIALRDNGTVEVWGNNSVEQVSMTPPNLTSIRSIAAGGWHTLALRSNGTVVAWGANDSGQSTVPSGATGVVAIAAGEFFSLALKSNGTVVAWGGNSMATVAATLNNIKAIAAGGSHALALRNAGTVVAWGSNVRGQTNVPVGLQASAVFAGGTHSLVIRTDGFIQGWGDNTHSQITPAPVANGVRSLFAGANHTGAVKNDGTVVCWGDNTFGQRTVPPLMNLLTAVSGPVANHNLAIQLVPPSIATQPQSQTVIVGQNVTFSVLAEGSPVLTYQWKRQNTNILGATLSYYQVNNAQTTNNGSYSVVVANSVGSVTSAVATLTVNAAPAILAHPQNQTVGLNANVTFSVSAIGTGLLHYQWLKNSTPIPNANASNYTLLNVQSSAAASYSVIVTNSFGSATSSNAVLTILPPPGFVQQPQSQQVLAGSSVTFRAMVTNAIGYQWMKGTTNFPGANSTNLTINRAQLPDAGAYKLIAWNDYGTNTSDAASLAVEEGTGGDVVLWGENAIVAGLEFVDMTPPGGLTGVSALALSGAHNIALRFNGSVAGWGDNEYGQAGLPPGVTASAVAAGANHTLLLSNGHVSAWGLNSSGQTTVPPLTNAAAIAAGGDVSMAVTADGTVSVWGANNANQRVIPPSATNIMEAAAGMEHCLALRRNGTVVGWGGNSFGQIRAPFSVTNANAAVAAISAGAFHSLALKSNGTVVAWGKGGAGQTNVPPEATNIVAIAAGGDHSIALRRDGTVLAWGQDNWGQIEVPLGLLANGIAAAGDRSMAIRRAGLRLVSPVIVSNLMRLVIQTDNGSAIPFARATNIEVIASSDLAAPTGTWITVPGAMVITNGMVIVQDPATQGRRFYRVHERP